MSAKPEDSLNIHRFLRGTTQNAGRRYLAYVPDGAHHVGWRCRCDESYGGQFKFHFSQ